MFKYFVATLLTLVLPLVAAMSDGNPRATSATLDDMINIKIKFKSRNESFSLPRGAKISDLSDVIAESLSVPVSNQKLLAPKLGLLKAPFSCAPPLSALEGKTVTLMGATAETVSSMKNTATVAARREQNRAAARLAKTVAKPFSTSGPRNNFGKEAHDWTYTFLSIQPLPYLPDPPASQRYLERLATDPGIRKAMKSRKFTVGLLTEMDPAMHTDVSHEGVGRTLGLNRNKGEVIELRLITDAGDGYRDYKTVRKTLCHELAHNVHGPHDSKFWKLCREIEREVEGFEGGGRVLEEHAGPIGLVGEDDFTDHGGWSGGEFVLGGGGQGSGLSRREIMARAAEERLRRLREERDSDGK